MVQVRGVTSEPLEAKIRELLPSQNGFTEELSAQNLIVPVIDLTQAAEGSDIDARLQQAMSISGDSFTSSATTANQVVSTQTGFLRCFGNWTTMISDTAGAYTAQFYLYDGTTKYNLMDLGMIGSVSVQSFNSYMFDFIVFCGSGVSLQYDGGSFHRIHVRVTQLADIVGTLVNPSGYTPQ